jgi:hypothetical protein
MISLLAADLDIVGAYVGLLKHAPNACTTLRPIRPQ